MKQPKFLQQCQKRINIVLRKLLPSKSQEPRQLHQAMHYAVLNGGKRLRSALVYATGSALQASPFVLDRISAAIEMIHAFSLIHDDLPALDNDDLRRGKPACHKAYGEAVAILAGDALQTLAFQLLADIPTQHLSAPISLKMIGLFARSIGHAGLAGGQTLDIAMTNRSISLKKLQKTYQLKTGNFITTGILMSAMAAGCQKKSILAPLKKFGDYLGLAFQIHDDIIEIESNTLTLGKPQGSDISRNKPTYPSLLGLAAAKKAELRAFSHALSALKKSNLESKHLLNIAAYFIEREF